MKPDEYAAMYAVEDEHWWYVGMRRVADALLERRFNGQRGSLKILDAGCGTGGNSAHLRAYGSVTGIDYSAEALAFARERPGLRLARASVESLPFADDAFDLVLSNDVLCHLGVANDRVAMREFTRVLRPGGVLFLQLPAYQWLRSHHDEAVHTGHRYTATEVRQLVTAGGLRVRRVTYANSLLLPAAAAWRAVNRFFPIGVSSERSDVRPVAEPVNRLMRAALGLEAPILARRNLPFGLSVIAVAQRPADAVPTLPVEARDRGSVGAG
ncbi:MAG: class I SAM-dependent methyltransferase [Dehalococcoidia bacterium]